jgi:hypothetical protein
VTVDRKAGIHEKKVPKFGLWTERFRPGFFRRHAFAHPFCARSGIFVQNSLAAQSPGKVSLRVDDA